MGKKKLEREISPWLIACIDMMKHSPPEVIVLSDAVRNYCEIIIEKAGNFKDIEAGFERLPIEKWPDGLRKKALIKALEFFEQKASPKSKEISDEQKKFLFKYLLPNSVLLGERLRKLFQNFADSFDAFYLCWIIDDLPRQFRDAKITVLRRLLIDDNFHTLSRGVERVKRLFPGKMPESIKILRDKGMERLLAQAVINEWVDGLITKFRFSPKKKLELIRNAFAGQKEGDTFRKEIMAFLVLRHVPELPEDLQEEYFDYLHATEQPKKITSQALKIIKEICGKRYILVTYEFFEELHRKVEGFSYQFHRMNEIPVFQDIDWFVRDTEQKIVKGEVITTGALLCFEYAERVFGSTQAKRTVDSPF
jgi:hypothetical protein